MLMFKEFQDMINPPKPPEGPKPTKALFNSLYEELSAPRRREDDEKEKMICNIKEDISLEKMSIQMNHSESGSERDFSHTGGFKSVNFVIEN